MEGIPNLNQVQQAQVTYLGILVTKIKSQKQKKIQNHNPQEDLTLQEQLEEVLQSLVVLQPLHNKKLMINHLQQVQDLLDRVETKQNQIYLEVKPLVLVELVLVVLEEVYLNLEEMTLRNNLMLLQQVLICLDKNHQLKINSSQEALI